MIVNASTVSLAFKGFKTVFTDAWLETPANADKIVMTVPSASRDETYGWLGQFPSMREWVGPRHVKNLVANGFVIANRKFESTLEISRDDIADDKPLAVQADVPGYGTDGAPSPGRADLRPSGIGLCHQLP